MRISIIIFKGYLVQILKTHMFFLKKKKASKEEKPQESRKMKTKIDSM